MPIPHPDDACTYCDRSLRYDVDSGEPWAKELAGWQLGPCCATEWIREQFKSEGIATAAVAFAS